MKNFSSEPAQALADPNPGPAQKKNLQPSVFFFIFATFRCFSIRPVGGGLDPHLFGGEDAVCAAGGCRWAAMNDNGGLVQLELTDVP
ncbi:hypothetical protein [Ramlibacter sp. 2FC]|uniref:hypothetical protein n=1 Tax=Ramlibacter sp. 2FC TaxID=2502188 RepID=UPI0010F57D7E|nr:hypothetical protein [Ramlibacter sp. 2FC]